MNYEKIVNSNWYAVLEKILNLVLINLLWFLISFFGLGLLTIYPATLVVFMLVSLIIENKTFPVLKGFFKLLIKFYWKAQKIFLIFLTIGIILFFNIRFYYFQLTERFTYIALIGFVLTLLIILLTIFALIHSFFIILYFPDFKTFKTIKFSYLFGIAFAFSSLLVLILFLIASVIIIFVPFLLILVCLILTSLLAYLAIKIIKPKYNKTLPNIQPLNLRELIK